MKNAKATEASSEKPALSVAYRALAETGHVQPAFCWAHVRRRFYEIAAAGAAPIATEALARIAEL